ncbi:MAG: hypothetical protein ABIL09_13740 [Gemmatimonadota bacterium]
MFTVSATPGSSPPRRCGLALLAAACAALLAADLLGASGWLYHKHGHYAVEGWFGFQAVVGLGAAAGCLLAGWAASLLRSRDEVGDA